MFDFSLSFKNENLKLFETDFVLYGNKLIFSKIDFNKIN